MNFNYIIYNNTIQIKLTVPVTSDQTQHATEIE